MTLTRESLPLRPTEGWIVPVLVVVQGLILGVGRGRPGVGQRPRARSPTAWSCVRWPAWPSGSSAPRSAGAAGRRTSSAPCSPRLVIPILAGLAVEPGASIAAGVPRHGGRLGRRVPGPRLAAPAVHGPGGPLHPRAGRRRVGDDAVRLVRGVRPSPAARCRRHGGPRAAREHGPHTARPAGRTSSPSRPRRCSCSSRCTPSTSARPGSGAGSATRRRSRRCTSAAGRCSSSSRWRARWSSRRARRRRPLAGAWDGLDDQLIDIGEEFGRLFPTGGDLRGGGGVTFGSTAPHPAALVSATTGSRSRRPCHRRPRVFGGGRRRTTRSRWALGRSRPASRWRWRPAQPLLDGTRRGAGPGPDRPSRRSPSARTTSGTRSSWRRDADGRSTARPTCSCSATTGGSRASTCPDAARRIHARRSWVLRPVRGARRSPATSSAPPPRTTRSTSRSATPTLPPDALGNDARELLAAHGGRIALAGPVSTSP